MISWLISPLVREPIWRGKRPVEAFELVASYSQDPLTYQHVNMPELPDELHDPAAVAGCRSVLAGENQGGRPGAVAKAYADPKDALADIETADAAYGTVPPNYSPGRKAALDLCLSRPTASPIGRVRCASPAGRAQGSFRLASDRSGSGRA